MAAIIGVSEDCVRSWENNQAYPQIHWYPKIIAFLGYFPFEIGSISLAQKMIRYRYLYGLTQGELAKYLDVNESTVFRYEKDGLSPSTKVVKKLEKLLTQELYPT